MLNSKNMTLAAALVAASALSGFASEQKQVAPKPQDKFVLAEPKVEELLPLAAPANDTKVSKEEWLKFMAAEFDRLDKSGSGVVDVTKMAPSTLWETGIAKLGK
ncbi:MAG: hypothetical protein ABSG51_06595 [Terracidiphilus sp.]